MSEWYSQREPSKVPLCPRFSVHFISIPKRAVVNLRHTKYAGFILLIAKGAIMTIPEYM